LAAGVVSRLWQIGDIVDMLEAWEATTPNEFQNDIIIAPRPHPAYLILIGLAALSFLVPCGQAARAQDAHSFDPLAVVHVHSAEEAVMARKAIIRDIWKTETLPDDVPVEVTNPAPSFGANNIASSEVLTRTMDFGVKSHAYLYLTSKFAGCLFIYHSGHGEEITDEVKSSLWKRMVEGGCDLLYLAMPLMHQNPKPTANSSFGPLLLGNHDYLSLLQSEVLNPLKFFVDPVLASLNYAVTKRGGYGFIFMAGLSGGGWTTTLYAAIDPRISASFPVAGSLPVSLKTFSDANIGDWEQYAASIYKLWDYLDLYVLATYPARTQVQLLNVYDSCCFKGTGARIYERPISQLVKAWEGVFSVTFDENTHVHEVSAQHVETILATVTSLSGVVFPARTPPPEQCEIGSAMKLVPPFRPEIGHAFQAMLPAQENQADNAAEPHYSKSLLCEDGKPLGPAHSLHDTIRNYGNGSFSHWSSYLLFSTRDNSDPNTDGHNYTLVVPPVVAP
jgi:hypothetical protein